MSFKETEVSLAPPASKYLLACFFATVAAYLILGHGHSLAPQFADARVLAYALNDWLSGQNPYTTAHGPLRFVYPPLFLYTAGTAARLLPHDWGWVFYIAFNIGCVLALPLIFSRFYYRRSWLNTSFMFLIFLAEPQFATVLALASGNVACVLYCLTFLAAVPGIKKNRWGWFYVAVLIAASIKITFLLMLLLPIFAGRKQLLQSFFSACSVVTVIFLQRIFMSQLYADYRQSVGAHVIADHQYGFGSFGIAAALDYKFHHVVGGIPYAVAILFTAALLISLAVLRRHAASEIKSDLWLAMVIVAITLANPRILHYDIYFGLAAAFILLVSAFNISRRLACLMLLLFVSFLLPVVANSAQIRGSYETLLLLIGYIAMYRKIWVNGRQAYSDEEQLATLASVDS